MIAQRVERLAQKLRLEGHEKGLREGRQQGHREGRREGELAMLRRLLERKFGQLQPETIERLERADVDLLLSWSDRILTATTLSDVFELS